MGIYRLSSFEYLNLVERGPSKFYDKIKNDTFRTCATDRKFLAKVDEGMLSRVLNAFVWKMEGKLFLFLEDGTELRTSNADSLYRYPTIPTSQP